jgi:hypothetical protein
VELNVDIVVTPAMKLFDETNRLENTKNNNAKEKEPLVKCIAKQNQ